MITNNNNRSKRSSWADGHSKQAIMFVNRIDIIIKRKQYSLTSRPLHSRFDRRFVTADLVNLA